MNEHVQTSELIAFELPQMPDPVMVADSMNKAFSDIYANVEQQIAEHEPDVTTDKGRKAIASLAHKIARLKTSMDAEATKLTEGQKRLIDAVNKERREMKEKLDAYKAQARRPLTEWEEAEEARAEKAKSIRNSIRDMGTLSAYATIDDARRNIELLREIKITADIFDEYVIDVEKQRDDAIALLESVIANMEHAEAERAELQRLREAEEKRQAEEQAKIEAEAAERRRVEAEKQAAEERERIAKEAEDKARREAEEKAAAELAESERQKQAALQAAKDAEEREKRAAVEAERRVEQARQEAAEAERRRTEAAEAERQRVAAEERAAADRRAANERHRASVNYAAVGALMKAADLEEAQAAQVVVAIADGLIPHVTISY